MFIKFSDKTKKIIVKRSKEDAEKEEEIDSEAIYLDENKGDDRRIKILNKENLYKKSK